MKAPSNNALNQLAIKEVSRRLTAMGVEHDITGRSSANLVPGHLVIHAEDGDYFLFVRVARLKTQTDRSKKVIAGRTQEYFYERKCWEANMGSHGMPISPAPDFWAIVLAEESPRTVDDRDPILMIPNERVEGQTLRIAEKGPMSRWLVYLDWAPLVEAIDPPSFYQEAASGPRRLPLAAEPPSRYSATRKQVPAKRSDKGVQRRRREGHGGRPT